MVLWFYVQEQLKAQPAVVLILKRLRRRGQCLKSHPTDWEKISSSILVHPSETRVFSNYARDVTVVQIKTEYVQVKNDFLALHGEFLEQQLVRL